MSVSCGLLLMAVAPLVAAGSVDDGCGSCTTSVVVAVVVTLVIVALLQLGGYFLWKAYWRGKAGQHLLVTDPEKGDSIYAFDNPGFKEGSPVVQVEEKDNQKVKWPQWSSVGLVTGSNAKVKAMDDSYTAQPALRVVPLRSHDFTGLGFNICGNMRDGIFVKDVLHRGPASESGSITPGDRIESVKISLKHMVLEDALTILSYASPYEVELAVEEGSGGGGRVAVAGVAAMSAGGASPGAAPGLAGGTLLRHHNTTTPRIVHPFYRSHSISDLHKIEKSATMTGRRTTMASGCGGGGERSGAEEGGSETPTQRKSKAVEAVENIKNKMIESSGEQPQKAARKQPKPEDEGGTVKVLLAKGIQNLKDKLHLHTEEEKREDPPEKSDDETDTKPVVAESPEDIQKFIENSQDVVQEMSEVPEEVRRAGAMARINRKSAIVEEPLSPLGSEIGEDPVAAKRNKRKAPMPPQDTKHDEDDDEDEGVCGGDSDSDEGATTMELEVTVHRDAEESGGRKTCSLGDLSRYDDGGHGASTLERAVSLDLEDGGGSARKRKAPPPPPPLPLEDPPTVSLKKSSVWGTLEDVLCVDEEDEFDVDEEDSEDYDVWATPNKGRDEGEESHDSYVTEVAVDSQTTLVEARNGVASSNAAPLVKPARATNNNHTPKQHNPSRIPVRAAATSPSLIHTNRNSNHRNGPGSP